MAEEIVSVRKRRTLLLYTKQCRHCGLPFSTTSSVAIVHPECRIAYYQKKALDSYRKNSLHSRSADIRSRKKCYVDDPAHTCEACGYTRLTKEKKFYHPAKEGETEGKYILHTLCFNCIMQHRYGLMEALTWKPLAA